jgi:hypothetical protein
MPPKSARQALMFLVLALAFGLGAVAATGPGLAARPHADLPPLEDLVPPKPVRADGKPRLAVLLIFDQLRGDYPTRWRNLYGKDGFNRLLDEGCWFPNCHYPYAVTVTGAGHASPRNSLSTPAMILSSVLLPAPLWPSTPIFAP